MIHHWLGWASLAIGILLLAKFIGRISKKQKLNSILRKIHKPLGMTLIGVAALHGIISIAKAPQAVVQIVTGVILLVLIGLLARTFYARDKLKAKWFQMHRHFALAFLVVLVIHVVTAVA
ncbi:MAG: hypothetical protein Q4D31_06025 [Eubacteriales bacterium]|nr:hypothetical protein [Eubacteriales bacterium]